MNSNIHLFFRYALVALSSCVLTRLYDLPHPSTSAYLWVGMLLAIVLSVLILGSTSSTPKALGDCMKHFEGLLERKFHPTEPMTFRLDGSGFSKKTRPLTKGKHPFDMCFARAMAYTTADLLKHYHATTAYVQSDEITLVFAPACTKEEYKAGKIKEHIFSGRMMKIATNCAGYASTRFTHHITRLVQSVPNYETEYKEFLPLLEAPEFCFDNRPIQFPKLYQHLSHLIWRCRDGYRNYISMFARLVSSEKNMIHMHSDDRIRLMKEHGFDFEASTKPYQKWGVLLKKEKVELANCIRHHVIAKSLHIHSQPAMVDLIFAKMWDSKLTEQTGFKFYDVDILDGYLDDPQSDELPKDGPESKPMTKKRNPKIEPENRVPKIESKIEDPKDEPENQDSIESKLDEAEDKIGHEDPKIEEPKDELKKNFVPFQGLSSSAFDWES